MSASPAWALDSIAPTAEVMRRWAAPSDERLRVLLLARWPVGAVRAHLVNHYVGLHEHGCRFTFVGPDGPSLSSLQSEFWGMGGLEFVGAAVENRCCRLWPVVRSLLREGRFDLVHSHGMTAAAHAALANLGIGIPHVATLHESLRANPFPGWLGPLKNWTLSQTLQKADAIVTLTEAARADLLERLPILQSHADRIVPIPNGIPVGDAPAVLSQENSLRTYLGLESDVFLIGFHRWLSSDEAFAIVLSSIAHLRNSAANRRFHLVGLGHGPCRSGQQIILRRGLEKQISLVPASSLPQFTWSEMDLLFVPSASAAAMQSAMEAMAGGVPVLALDSAEMRELLHQTPSRLTAVQEPMTLAEQLQQAITQPWSEEARSYAPQARRRFDHQHSLRRLRELLESFVKPARQQAQAA